MTERKAIHVYRVKTIAEFYLGENVFNVPVEFTIKDFNDGLTVQQLIDLEFKRHNMDYNKKKKHFFINQIV